VTQLCSAAALGSGAAAGVVATTVFTIADHLFINSIWFRPCACERLRVRLITHVRRPDETSGVVLEQLFRLTVDL
jgi:hypothetical protein